MTLLRRLCRDRGGTALMEFALALPLVMGMGGYCVELSNLAMTNMKVSQIALQLADNGSRVGVATDLAVYQLREGDINDVLQGARLVGSQIDLTTRGRVIVSSLENVRQSYDTATVQRIHWQRCVGAKSAADYGSSYGIASTSAGGTATKADAGLDAPNGMGDVGSKVSAPGGSAVIFVEINYEYKPLFGSTFVSPTRLHQTASFIVRDRRDFSQVFNPAPVATKSTCDKYTT